MELLVTLGILLAIACVIVYYACRRTPNDTPRSTLAGEAEVPTAFGRRLDVGDGAKTYPGVTAPTAPSARLDVPITWQSGRSGTPEHTILSDLPPLVVSIHQTRFGRPLAPEVTEAPERPAAPKRPPALDPERCWISAGQSVSVAGYAIPDGMLFVGEGLEALRGYEAEPALIDPSLPIDREDPNRAGTSMPYWPSYSTISPSHRAAYLEWLAGGRSQPDAYIGYVFLFFYGLERRVLAHLAGIPRATPELRSITSEVERLLGIYGPRSRSFGGYGGDFLSLLTLATQDTVRSYERQPPVGLVPGDLPLLLGLGLGQAAADEHPLPPDWALAWVEATTPLRTPATRCPAEFRALYRLRYRETFGDGLRLSAGRTALAWRYRPASASFGAEFTVQLDVSDVTTQARSIAKLVTLAERCCDDLDAYSRWLGRHGDGAPGLAALALLPAELAANHASDDVDKVCQALHTAIGSESHAVVDAEPLVRAWPSGDDGKLAKPDALLLAQALERRGYGLEPDIRFGGRVLTAPGRAVVFRLPAGPPATASRQYGAATLLVHMATVVAAADEELDGSETRHVIDHLHTALQLSPPECTRLAAHFAWLQLDRPAHTGIKKRVVAVNKSQRQDIAKFLVTLAAADGRIAPAEVMALTKIYRLLGLDPQSAYGDLHALGMPLDDEPVTVRPASPANEFTIPEASTVEAPIVLDMRRVALTLKETAAVAALLHDVFDDDETEATRPAPAEVRTRTEARPVVPGTASGVQSSDRELLRSLGERAAWSRLDFERLAERLQVMPDGALERVNEAALDRFGVPVCEGEDPIVVDITVVKEMLA